MTIFWILAAGLLGLASFFVALPLIKRSGAGDDLGQDELNLQVFRQRLAELDGDLASGFLDQAQYEAARRDLERELLYDLDAGPDGVSAPRGEPRGATRSYPVLALALVALVSAGTVLTYLQIGERHIIPRIEAMATAAPLPHAGGAPGEGAPSLDVLVQGLAERMEQNPDNLEGWLMLGRTYFAMGQAPKALEAVERAYKLAPEDTSVLIAYAEALAANSGNRLEGRPAELIRTVLAQDPENAGARWLDGMHAYQQERFGEAAETWQGILNELDPAGEEADQMRQMIADARGRAGAPGAEAAPSEAATTAPSASAPSGSEGQVTLVAPASPETAVDTSAGTTISVAVDLDPAISGQTEPEDAVFVYARAASGPPMPLAVQRYRVADLPLSVTLDDSMAMVPAMQLSAFPQVVVGARISKSGQATPQPGDLEGQTGPIAAAETPRVSVIIDRVRP